MEFDVSSFDTSGLTTRMQSSVITMTAKSHNPSESKTEIRIVESAEKLPPMSVINDFALGGFKTFAVFRMQSVFFWEFQTPGKFPKEHRLTSLLLYVLTQQSCLSNFLTTCLNISLQL